MTEEAMQKAGQEIIDIFSKHKLSRFEMYAVLEGVKQAAIMTELKKKMMLELKKGDSK